jgi:hypothetical protein
MANRNPNRKGLMPAWKPGKSGNPSGRPRRKPVSGRYEFMCEVPLPESIRKKLGLEAGATYGDALSLMQFRAALNGNTGAAREIREAIEGKAAIRDRAQIELRRLPLLLCMGPRSTIRQNTKRFTRPMRTTTFTRRTRITFRS